VSPIFKRNSQVSSSQTGLNILNVINSISPQSGSNLNTKRSETTNFLKKRFDKSDKVEKIEKTEKIDKTNQQISKVFYYLYNLLEENKKLKENKFLEEKKFHSAVIDNQRKGHKRTNTGGSINLDDKKIFNMCDNNYIQTEPLPNNQLLLLLNQSGVKNSKKPHDKEDAVISCLTNSLKIFEKIQKDFEMSAKNNIVDIEENRINACNGELSNRSSHSRFREREEVNGTSSPSSPGKTQSTRELAKLGLQINKIRDFNYYQVINVSQVEKNRISKHIEDNSETRIKNYTELFSIINSTLEDIKDSIRVLNTNCYSSQVSLLPVHEKNEKHERHDKHEKKKNKNDDKNLMCSHIDENVEYNVENFEYNEDYKKLKEDLLCPPKSRKVSKNFSKNVSKNASKNASKSPSFIQEESCDFSETSMLENAIIAPPKLENRCSLLVYQDFIRTAEKKESFSRMNKFDKLDLTGNLDRTIIEYDSIIMVTEEFEKNTDEKIEPVFKDKYNYEK
jgi:hypothetical protein